MRKKIESPVKKGITGLVLVCVGFYAFGAFSAEAALSKKVIGNIAYWDQARGFQNLQDNADVFSGVSPTWYSINSSGDVLANLRPDGTSYVDDSIISYAKTNHIKIVPTIQNVVAGFWSPGVASSILNSPTSVTRHINTIVNLVVNMDYDGIDIDYENLPATDRVVFSSFIENLATALHAQGKSLSVDVYAKTFEPGYWNGPQSEDWTRIGSAADEVRIMMYGYSWQTSIPGPIAPISWVNEVLAFAKTVIPASKIIHGLPGYGIDWPSGSAGTEFMWDDLNARVTNFGATLNWDLTSMSPWFQYVSSGKAHTVWFENAASTAAKISSTSNYDVGGVFVWRLGGEDPQIWNSIRTEFNGTIPPAVPTVTIKAGGQDADITISYNTSTTISWSSANADNCTVAPTGWVGLSSTGISTGNLTSTTTYTVSCVGGGATAADSIKINVTPQITADTTAPTVSITDPLAGSLLNKKARIVVIASDNVKVTKVQIYTDSSLLATVTTAPYVTTWNTARVTPGSHVVRAVAYDASGNNAATQITVSAR